MTKHLRQLRALFQFWTILFGIGGLIFFILPEQVVTTLNATTKWLPFLSVADPTPAPFWRSLSLSLMVTLTFMSLQVVRSVETASQWVIAVLLSKVASTIFFFFYYVKQGFPAPYFWGALCDGTIFLITFIFFKRAYLKLKP